MLQMIMGAHVPDPALLAEGYEVNETCISANVDAEHILKVMMDFMEQNADRLLFLFIEVPTNAKYETTGKTQDGYVVTETKHMDVYYLDGRSSVFFTELLHVYGSLLVHDGLCHFGVGNNIGEEIGKYKYNVMSLHCREENVETYASLFENAGIRRTKHLVTAWDTFKEACPGTCERLTARNGKDVYDIIEELKAHKLYFAQRREE